MVIVHLCVNVVKAIVGNSDSIVAILHATAKKGRPNGTTALIPLSDSPYTTQSLPNGSINNITITSIHTGARTVWPAIVTVQVRRRFLIISLEAS